MKKKPTARFVATTIEAFCRSASPDEMAEHEIDLVATLEGYATSRVGSKRRSKYRAKALNLVLGIADQKQT